MAMTLPEFPPVNLLPLSSAEPGHTNVAELPWVAQGEGIEVKLVHVNHSNGTWVTLHRFQPGVQVPAHRHAGIVIAYTLSGRWGYREHDFVATAGSVVHEPAGSFHTLYIPEDNDGPTEVLFVMSGGLALANEDGSLWGVADAQTELAAYEYMAQLQGTPIPEGAILK